MSVFKKLIWKWMEYYVSTIQINLNGFYKFIFMISEA